MYEKFTADLEKVCEERGFSLETLGEIEGGGESYPIHAIALGQAGDPLVVFSAGIHGDEPASCWGALEFLKAYAPEEHALRVLIFPLANPYGFAHALHEDAEGKNPNRFFGAGKEEKLQSLVLARIAAEGKPALFHSLHEDIDSEGFYLYPSGKGKDDFYARYLAAGGAFFPLYHGVVVGFADRIENGVWIAPEGATENLATKPDSSFEERVHSDDVPYVVCTETPGKKPLAERVSCSRALMETSVTFADAAFPVS